MPSKDPTYMRRYMQEYRQRRREKCVAMLGGKCNRCGSREDLEFDHVDPATKLFDISGSTQGWQTVVAELAKCQLLCSECHERKTVENGDGRRLTIAQAEEIRQRYRLGGITHRQLAQQYDVAHATIGDVLRGRTYRQPQFG